MDAPRPTVAEEDRPRRDTSIGFGVERIGLAALRWPAASMAVLAIALFVAAVGIPQLRFDDNLQNVFNSGAPEDVAYRDLARDFAVGEAEILLFAEAPSFEDVAAFETLRRVHFEAQLLENVAGVTSIFSLREPPAGDTQPAPILGPDIAADAIGSALARLDRHPFNLGKLISPDRGAALIAIRGGPDVNTLAGQRQLIGELRAAAANAAAGSDVRITVTGIPTLRVEIVRRLISDSIIVNLLGALIATAIGLILFLSLRLTMIAVAPPILAAATVLGGMGLAGVGVNAMTLVIPVLILVMVFADSMHLTFAWMRGRASGLSPHDAAHAALKQVGPACVLATATTIIAFGAIAISRTYIVQEFGVAGAVANLLGLGLLLAAHPTLCRFLGWGSLGTAPRRGAQSAFARLAAATARFVAVRPRMILLVGVALTVVTAAAHANLPPNYSIREHLPTDDAANAALERIDRNLNGAYAVQIPVPLPEDSGALDAAKLGAIRAVHTAVEGAMPGAAVLSVWSLAEWVGADGPDEAARRLAPLWEDLSPAQRRRMLAADGESALVTTWIHELPAIETDQLVSRIEAAVAGRWGPVQATGLVVHSARKAQYILDELKLSLLVAVVLAIGLIALAFRSVPVGLVSLLPNVLPILVTGTFLLLIGRGLQFASALALTIAFGIAVNDTIHFLNRYRHERAQGSDSAAAIPEAVRTVGPVMISTTLVLCAGLAATLASSLPMTALFGMLCVLLLVTALIADLTFLPALILEYPKRWKRGI